MGLKISDLVGKMSKVEILDFSQSEKEGKSIVVLKCKDSDKQFDVGLFGCADDVLDKHGTTEKGKNFLQIPASKIVKEGMVWINHPY